MKQATLGDLQESVRDRSAFKSLDDYLTIGRAFLAFLRQDQPTRIVSPAQPNYTFFQYSGDFGHKITRPLNTNLLIESASDFKDEFERFMAFLADLRKYQGITGCQAGTEQYAASCAVNRIVYTIQQAIGCVSDAFADANQSRKRAGQLFETLVRLVILDGVYYVDPWPEMLANQRLREQIFDFQRFLVHDLWSLTSKQAV